MASHDQLQCLTQWEKTHLEHVVLLWKQAETAKVDLGEKEKADEDVDVSFAWLNFRIIVYNLYSVLDYTYYLLHSHLSHNGGPAPREKAIQLCFPYTPKGVKTSETDQDQTEKFVKDKANILCSESGGPAKTKDAEGIIRDIILPLQPTVKVDGSGKPVGGSLAPQVSGKGAECLAMLHFFRNCVTHRDLIVFKRETLWAEYGKTTGVYTLVKESGKQKGVDYYPLEGKRFWIELPPSIEREEKHMMLLHVLDIFGAFVQETFTAMLQRAGIAYNLPSLPKDPRRNDSSSASATSSAKSSQCLDDKPMEKDLMGISKRITQRWKPVCTYLGISQEVYYTYEQNNPSNVQQACFDALAWWLQNAKSPTWRSLIKALRDGDFNGLAKEIEAKF